MQHRADLIQDPPPGDRCVRFCGDVLRFELRVPAGLRGSAWLRTNLGHAAVTRAEIVRSVHLQQSPLGRDWFDLPMHAVAENRFVLEAALLEPGHFEAKCFFLEEGATGPVWPPGPNTVVNVDAADSCAANIVYNAFVRQFGPNKSARRVPPPGDETCVQRLDALGYTVIPPSGTFRDLIGELDFILGTLGCRIVLLLPIHPTPTTYGRMGRFGSPYAALSFRSVDPALAVFDPRATPTEQFIELVDAVHRRNGRLFLDIAINHTGWAANLHTEHPEWLCRSEEGRIEVPGAWGVQWEDLTQLDYRHPELWRFMAEVFLTWCRRGVDGFRCDAGYMIPHAAWRYMVARVREEFPDTVFLLEGLGGRISVTRSLLDTANLNWAYSELFQNYDRSQIEHYLPGAIEIASREGLLVHFAETHDNLRLAATSHAWAKMRTALCALSSFAGAFGFANGVEWFAAEKIDVHDAAPLNWGAPVNQVDWIARLNRILKEHPALHAGAEIRLVERGGGNQLVLLRHDRERGKRLLVLVNLDPQRPTPAFWDPRETGDGFRRAVDLLSGETVEAFPEGGLLGLPLEAGQVRCLSPDPSDLDALRTPVRHPFAVPARIERQRMRAKGLEVVARGNGGIDVTGFDPDRAAAELKADPARFLERHGEGHRLTRWHWPRDLKREVMLPPGHFLLLSGGVPFRARIVDRGRTLRSEISLPAADGSHFCLFPPLPPPRRPKRLSLRLRVHEPETTRHEDADLLLLPEPDEAFVRLRFSRVELLETPRRWLATNGRGAMARAAISWGRLESRYDGLLAANPDPERPVDRRMLLTRCRLWLVYQGFSQEVNLDCLQSFAALPDGGFCWRFRVPCGQGEHVLLSLLLRMPTGRNAVHLVFHRHRAGGAEGRLADAVPVRLIVRPDIENRSVHEPTKAYTGPEHRFPAAIRPAADGFRFAPDPGPPLEVRIAPGRFALEPQWEYMVHRPADAERGEDPHSDLFSPGYFEAPLAGGCRVTLTAADGPEGGDREAFSDPSKLPDPCPEPRAAGRAAPLAVLREALGHYLVERDGLKTVIAGYPWFLDWGWDSLIFCRGLIAAGRLAEARSVLGLFGRFEEGGTLPNMIRGADTANRDTSDAPLWFVVCCADLAAACGLEALRADCGGRSLAEVAAAIVRGCRRGLKNGVHLDPESGLLFSPTHFTWMDTQHPAGSPREGYPIEIQALWHAALALMARLDPEDAAEWEDLAHRVRRSLIARYWRPDDGFFADCLHAAPGTPARDARADDHLRPNQLLALTLGAVNDPAIGRSVLAACEELLVPGAIRSLADRPVTHPLPVEWQGRLLNDPSRPYRGVYRGDEDTQRKPAYHNGTAWTWLFPAYAEAWAGVYGEAGRKTALAWLTGSIPLLESGCLGHLPEILDGDRPHTPRGCDAQAWGASEWVRVWIRLSGSAPAPARD